MGPVLNIGWLSRAHGPRSCVGVVGLRGGGRDCGRLMALVGLGDEEREAIGKHLAPLLRLEPDDLRATHSRAAGRRCAERGARRTRRRAAQWMVSTRLASSPCRRRDARGSQPRETSSISTSARLSNLSPLTTLAVFLVFHWIAVSAASRRKMRGADRPLRLYLNAAKPRAFIVCLNLPFVCVHARVWCGGRGVLGGDAANRARA